MNHPLIVRRDLDFLLHDWLGVAGAFDREAIDAVLDLSEKLAVDQFLPHFKQSDMIEPRLVDAHVHVLPAISDALKRYAELGLFAAGFAPQLGGLGLPYPVCAASFSYFAAANIAAAAYPMLTTANARLIVAFGSPAQIDAFARPQIAGEWFGTMCLSEPQAGSSLADVATRAVRHGDDPLGQRYRLTGNKMWISGGDHDAAANIVHLILAKVTRADGSLPSGTNGLSLFIVPKLLPDGARNDVSVAGLNHKMGYRGIPNCLLNLGEGGGAIGWLVGEEGAGLRQMFLMMNEARVSVGMGAAAIGYRAYRHAVAYAQERLQGRPIGQRGGAPVAIIHHPDVKRMLLAQKSYVEGGLALSLYAAKLIDEEDHNPDSAALLGLLTPVVKTWPSEYGLAASDLAIQVHGGYGYTRDFDVEQLYRDNRLNPIHEGTTGIQAIDLLGRKILRDDGRGMAVLRARIADTVSRADGGWPDQAAALVETWTRIAATVDTLRTIDGAAAFDNATPFLSAFGHGVVAWLWLDQALAVAASDHPDFADGKRCACRFFFDHEVPKIAAWLAPVDGISDAAAVAPAAIF